MARGIRGVALVVENPEGRILILQEFTTKAHLGKWAGMRAVPMETVEAGESREAAVARLVSEELTGLEPLTIDDTPFGCYRLARGIWAILYIAHATDSGLPSCHDGDVGNFAWVRPGEALTMWLRRGAREMIEDYAQGRQGSVRLTCAMPPSPEQRGDGLQP